MFDLKVPRTKHIAVDLHINTVADIFRQSLQIIGSYTGTHQDSKGAVVVAGKSGYGLQRVPIKISMEQAAGEATAVVIEAKSDDIFAKGAQKCIDRMLTAFDAIRFGKKEEIATLRANPFLAHTGFRRTTLFFIIFIALFAILLAVTIVS